MRIPKILFLLFFRLTAKVTFLNGHNLDPLLTFKCKIKNSSLDLRDEMDNSNKQFKMENLIMDWKVHH